MDTYSTKSHGRPTLAPERRRHTLVVRQVCIHPLVAFAYLARVGVMAYGPLTESQLFRLRRPLGVKERFALRVVMLELTIVVVIMALLTLLPQPLLLTATGTVNHSSFLHCLVPVTCVTLIIAGLTFGVGAGKIDGLAGAYNSLVAGFRSGGHLFVFYVLIVLLCSTIGYVFDL